MVAVAVPPAWILPVLTDTPLSWVPATAPIVIHVNGLETVRDHYVAFLQNAVPEWVDPVKKAFDKYYFEEFLDGRKLKGLAPGEHCATVWVKPALVPPAHCRCAASPTTVSARR